jgi:MoaA/NifB/PqqE/SkfB family radical SAM enzyme
MVNYLNQVKNIFFKKHMMPQFIVLYVTDACNLTCRHCFYYAELNKAKSISLENLEKLSKSIKEVVNISFTGGEPFLRSDFPEIIHLFHKNSKMSVASVPSNGILQAKILKDVALICEQNPKLILNITISLDGQQKTHDYIRMKEGGFIKSVDTLKKLCALKKRYKNLNTGVICTINEANENEVQPLFDEINDQMDINQFQINFIRGKTKELKPAPSTLRKYKEVNTYIRKKLLNKDYKGYDIFLGDFYNAITQRQKKVITQTLQRDTCVTQCYAGTSNCIIFPDGEVTACEIRYDVGMNNLKDFEWDFAKLMASKKAKETRQEILPSNCHCSFECQYSSNIVYNPKQLSLSILDLLGMKLGFMTNYFAVQENDNENKQSQNGLIQIRTNKTSGEK